MSLKNSLNQIIKDRNGGIFTLKELEAYCHANKYKLSNAERRLRQSESPNIERVFKSGAIIGYRYREEIIFYTTSSFGTICSCFHFKTFRYCEHTKAQSMIAERNVTALF